ncbi:citrate synthase-like protein [Sparassis latifolia]
MSPQLSRVIASRFQLPLFALSYFCCYVILSSWGGPFVTIQRVFSALMELLSNRFDASQAPELSQHFSTTAQQNCQKLRQSTRTIVRQPPLAATMYRNVLNVLSDLSCPTCSNVAWMLRHHVLVILFLLHGDHGLNISCTTVLQTGSSLVDPCSPVATNDAAVVPAVVILWLSSERGSSNLVSLQHWASTRWCERGRRSDANLDRTSGERVERREKTLSGFGHRVYKNSDPRSFIVRKTADEFFKVTGKDELLEMAMALHSMQLPLDEVLRICSKCGLLWTDLLPGTLIMRYVGSPLDFFPVVRGAESGRMASLLASDDAAGRRCEDLASAAEQRPGVQNETDPFCIGAWRLSDA